MAHMQYSSPFYQQIENPAVISLLRPSPCENQKRRSKKSNYFGGGLLRMFKLFPMLSSGCKMAALLGRTHRKAMLKDSATTGTIFGHRKGRVNLAIQEDPHCLPMFIIELPMLTSSLQKEMASDVVRIALESESTRSSSKKKLLEELVWGVYCNGRKVGYSIRRKQMSEDEVYVMQVLRGVSMGAGVLPNNNNNSNNNQKDSWCSGSDDNNDQMTYMRARFERVVGSKDSEALYMINPDGAATGAELSIFFVRGN